MPMPHRTFAQVAKRRLVGQGGAGADPRGPRAARRAARLQERAVRGPAQGAHGRDRGHARRGRRRSTATRSPSAARAPPRSRSSGRPTSASRRCSRRCRRSRSGPGDYAFTTLRPGARADADRRGARPAGRDPRPDRGRERGPRRRQGPAGRAAGRDAIVYCARAGSDPRELRVVLDEVAAGGDREARVHRRDAGRRGARRRGRPRWPPAFPELSCPRGLRPRRGVARRVLRRGVAADRAASGSASAPTAPPTTSRSPLHPPATVVDVADAVHHELAEAVRRARGSGARRRSSTASGSVASTVVQDGDVVEILR